MRRLTVNGMKVHPRWFRCLHLSFWKEVERQADYWARLNAANNARKRAARVAEKHAA
jgi:hypothetical protein